MNVIFLASLSLAVLAQYACVYGYDPYQFVTKCQWWQRCIRLKCAGGYEVKVPFGKHYLCCNGRLFDDRKFSCVRYVHSGKYALYKCNTRSQFQCKDGGCTLSQWKCNRVKDCRDGSDETGCGYRCNSYQFRCGRSRYSYTDECISSYKVCNGVKDCADGSDEAGCGISSGGRCGPNDYRCKNHRCIPLNYVCNRFNNCGDNSDEYNCYSLYGRKRDEISSFTDMLLQDGGDNSVDAANGTLS